ncbi:MAG: cupin domain-containing protein [Pseudomonadota bacterium]|nr:cupin domain-containing protein [Pseudomonadota bacterium]
MKLVDIDSDEEVLLKSALERVEHLPAHKAEAQVFRYARPDLKEKPRAITRLCMGDIMCALVQEIKKGGETTLHSHTGMDGFYMVMAGRARFWGEEEKLIGEFGPQEGVYIPRDTKYWFESASEEEPLQLLQIEAFTKEKKNKYTSYTPQDSDEQLADEVTKINFYDAKALD